MSEGVTERDRSISGGTLRWFAVSLLRAWYHQIRSFIGAIAVTLPIAIVAIFVPDTRLPYLVALGIFTVQTSAALRKYDIDIKQLLNEIEIPNRTRTVPQSQRLAGIYLLLVFGMLSFFAILSMVTGILVAISSLAAPWLTPVALVVGPILTIKLESHLYTEHEETLTDLGIKFADRLFVAYRDFSTPERRQHTKDVELAKAVLTMPFSGQQPN